MFLPRHLISLLYNNLRRAQHAQSPPVLLLVSLEPDALCACRMLTSLFKRDYISHKLVPVVGYGDLARAGEEQIRPMRVQNGGSGGTVICLGVGGLVDLSAVLGLEATEEDENGTRGLEIWVIDARRPWNLGNVFGGSPQDAPLAESNGNARAKHPDVTFGELQQNYRPGRGGIIVFDDGDIGEELEAEREAYFKLEQLPPIDDDGQESDYSESESDENDSDDGRKVGRKRKSWADADEDDEDEDRPRQRRRSNSLESIPVSPQRPARRGLVSTGTAIPSSFPSKSPSPSELPPSHQVKRVSTRRNRRRLLRLKRKHEATLHAYYSLGNSYSEPVSSLVYSLASDLGKEDNNILWHAIVGVSSLELYGRSAAGVGMSPSSEGRFSSGWGGDRGERIRQVLRDEVRRLNAPDRKDASRGGGDFQCGESSGVIPTTAISPTDTSIRLSPEPRFLLIRHWSLYESMLHSPYLAPRLHVWTEAGVKRLHKFLAKMGISLAQSRQSYTHMDMDLKRGLRQRLLKTAPLYGLDGLVPLAHVNGRGREGWGFVRSWGWEACFSAVDVAVILGAILEVGRELPKHSSSGRVEAVELEDEEGEAEGEEYVKRFFDAYDALENIESLKSCLSQTQHLHRAILRTGTSLLSKRQIRHLRTFRMAVVREGPDVTLFTHPGALTKLALWIGEAIAEQERAGGNGGTKPVPLVLAGLNEKRGVYIVVGTGGGGGLGAGIAAERKREREERKKRKREEKEKQKLDKRAERLARKEERRKEKIAACKLEKGKDLDQNHDDDDDPEDATDASEPETETEAESSSSEEDDERDDVAARNGAGRNRFGEAFQEVVEETGARIKIDSFEHSVVEVRKDGLAAFLEALSMRAVV